MKLKTLRLSNFQSFGDGPTAIAFEPMTFFVGPNGAGKTAVLQALSRMFGFDPSMRRIRRTDFHSNDAEKVEEGETTTLWIEAQFEFPELEDDKTKHPTIPTHFDHMRLESADGIPRLRIRLTATLDADGDIEEQLHYVVQADDTETPAKTVPVHKHDRSLLQVHYLPARRDPTDHISFAAHSLLGRALRAADWQAERDTIAELTSKITEALGGNQAVTSIGEELTGQWAALHKGAYYTSPGVSFEHDEIERLLRHLSVGFARAPEDRLVDFSRLSDGQKSLLYLALVLTIQAIGRKVLAAPSDAFDVGKLRPALFTLVAMEEPENSLSPHYLGRVVSLLSSFSCAHDAQAVVATHAPSLLRRVPPEQVRYLRLNAERETVVTAIVMPALSDDGYKFVREAVQAFPELYFSRLVILGEGDSEEIVLPRMLRAHGMGSDDAAISVVPLGGRHVNHFWRLLHCLEIPYVTLLDLDLARFQGGWGRVKYVVDQLLQFPPHGITLTPEQATTLPKWNGSSPLLSSTQGADTISWLEKAGVFFSAPLDLDFAMLRQFAAAYGADLDATSEPDEDVVVAVLGKKHGDAAQYSVNERRCFAPYHERFKLGSKPAAHLGALASLDEATLKAKMPESIARLLATVKAKLGGVPE